LSCYPDKVFTGGYCSCKESDGFDPITCKCLAGKNLNATTKKCENAIVCNANEYKEKNSSD